VDRKAFGIRFVCAIAVSLVACAAADAQPRPTGGPFSGLFRGSPKEQPQTLDLRGSAFGSWDDNVLAQAPNGPGAFNLIPSTVKPGLASGWQAGLAYGFHTSGTRSQLTLNGNGSVQQFGSTSSQRLLFQNYDANAAFRTNITAKISTTFSAQSSYMPFYQYLPFLANTASADSPVSSDLGFAVNSTWVRSEGASASIEDRITKRTSISGTVGLDQRYLTADQTTLNTDTASMRLTHNLTRKFSFHIGYGVQEARYSTRANNAQPFRQGFVDFGFGYGDGLTLTFARYYTLNLTIGAAIAKNGDQQSVLTTGKQTQFLVNGSATLSRSLGTWDASIGYTRGTSYVIGFTEPFDLDSANAGISGPIVSRLFLSVGAGASRGQQIFAQAGSIVAYTGSGRLNLALASNLGLYAQVSYYKYSVPNALEIFGFMPQLERRSATVGINAWVPLLKQARQPRRIRGTRDNPATDQQ
jgi:hypothetical protein